ncbi:uncharacterized protein JCM6883_007077 [Sporobolomyces salmoneus]|uniref:uncharacterized protein n=1 Tax=Sporobolomyces salmoneus TaxID=183962 RepID=UPI0031750ACB
MPPSQRLRKIDTSPSSLSRSTTPPLSTGTRTTTLSTASRGVGGGGGDYCESPDSLYPQSSIHTTSPRARRRDTSPTPPDQTSSQTVIGMNQIVTGRKQSSTQRSEIPFIGGEFSSRAHSSTSSPSTSSSRPLFGSSNTNGITASAARRGSYATLYGFKGRRLKWSRIIAILGTLLAVYWLLRGWNPTHQPRKKLTERWWEVDDSELSPEDLSALLPKPTLSRRPPSPKPVSQSLTSGLTLSQILKLPSSLSSPSSSTGDYTALIHLTSSSQLLASHLHPLITSLVSQSPLAPSQILLLCPSGMEPLPSILTSFGPLVSILSYSPTDRNESPLLTLANAALPARKGETRMIKTKFVLFVDGHLPPNALGKGYVKSLLHAFGTKEFGSSVVSAGGLALTTKNEKEDRCIYPATNAKGGGGVSTRISIPSTPFLFPVSWLLPRSYSSPSSSSSADHDDSEELTITSTSPTILQAVPMIDSLPPEIGLSWALWTKSGVPTYALPIPLSSTSEEIGRSGAGGEGGGELDGWVCERLKRNLQSDNQPKNSRQGLEVIRKGFELNKGAGEGLRRIKGDRKKGGSSSNPSSVSSGLSLSALERAREMRKGSLVLLLSGKEELEAVRKIACRFGASHSGDDDEREGEGGLGRGDRELRIVVADWEAGDQEWEDRENELCHLEIIPLLPSSSSSSSTSQADTSISLPLIDMLDSKLSPSPAVVLYLSDGSRAREFEEVLKWMGGMFGVRKGGERLGRVRMEKELTTKAGEGGKGKMTVIGVEREELKRAEWIGALPIEALRHWHTPRIDVSVITNDRPVSLHRLLLSLRSAHYFGDDVSLSINLEQTADRLTHRLVDDFRWNHGPLQLRHRILLGGLMPAIVESWYPTSNDTYGVFLEDDVEVSPLFHGWLKFTILKYRYTLSGRLASSRLFGVSLYQQKNIELRPEGRQPFDAHKLFDSLSLSSTTPYLSQIPCSWGAVYFPEQWREFHSYLGLRLSELALPISEPIVPSIRSNKWPKSWKKYFIELVYLRGYTMLYPNYPDFESLSTNHLEKGTHVKSSQVEEKKKLLFEVPLLDVDSSLVDSLPGGQLPEWESLPVMDLWGSLASTEELVERGWQTTRQVNSCQTLPDLEAIRLKYDARELLCKKKWELEEVVKTRTIKTMPLPTTSAEREDGKISTTDSNSNSEEDVKVVVIPQTSEQEGVTEEERDRIKRDETAQTRKEVKLIIAEAAEVEEGSSSGLVIKGQRLP